MTAKPAKGFTLIELMIVVAIMAVLAALAYTNYSRYSFRIRRADGKEMLARVASAQERYFTNHNAYAVDLANLGFTASNANCPTVGRSEKCYYLVSTANGVTGDAQSFQLTAVAQGAQAQDVCGDLGLDNANNKTPPASNASKNSNGTCW